MAQIILRTRKVAEAKVARGVRKTIEEDEAITPVDAIVETWEDDVIPTSTVKRLYKIVKIPGLTKTELDDALHDIDIREVYKGSGDWSFEPPEEMAVWRDAGTIDDWKELKAKPKRLRSFVNLTAQEVLDLQSIGTTKATKIAILGTCKNLLTEKPENHDVVEGLNGN